MSRKESYGPVGHSLCGLVQRQKAKTVFRNRGGTPYAGTGGASKLTEMVSRHHGRVSCASKMFPKNGSGFCPGGCNTGHRPQVLRARAGLDGFTTFRSTREFQVITA